MTTQPKDGDSIDPSRKVEVPEPIKPKWQPTTGNTMTMLYGRGTPTPSPSLEEICHSYVQQYYPYLPKGSLEYIRRYNEELLKHS